MAQSVSACCYKQEGLHLNPQNLQEEKQIVVAIPLQGRQSYTDP